MSLKSKIIKKYKGTTERQKLINSPEFISWFGDWRILSKAKSLSDNVKGIYTSVFKDNVEESLFEISVQANSSPASKSGVTKFVSEEIVSLALQLYPNAKIGDKFYPVVSKVVDSNGEPLSVYHGSYFDFNVFDRGKLSAIYDEQSNEWHNTGGFYFSNDFEISSSYKNRRPNKSTNKWNYYKSYFNQHRIKEFFLNLKNPLIINGEGKNWDKIKTVDGWNYSTDDISYETFKEGKYDGVIFYNIHDTADIGQILKTSNSYVAFHSNQIKLADGSNTTFYLSNPDIRFNDGGKIPFTPLPKSEIIGKKWKDIFPKYKYTTPAKWRIVLKSYYSAIERLEENKYKRINERTSDERRVKHYGSMLDKIKYLSKIKLDNTGTIIEADFKDGGTVKSKKLIKNKSVIIKQSEEGVSYTKNGITVTIKPMPSTDSDSHDGFRKGRMYITISGVTKEHGYWMDWEEKHWGITRKEYKKLPINERMFLEAKEQFNYSLKNDYNNPHYDVVKDFVPIENTKFKNGGVSDEKIKILYLHGLGATPKSDHVSILKSNDIDIISPYFDYNRGLVFDFISEEIIDKENIKGIVGHSMGGYLAYYLSNKHKIPALMFNPAFGSENNKLQPIPDYDKELPPYENQMAVVGSEDEDVPAKNQLEFLEKTKAKIFIEKVDHDIPDSIKIKYFNKFFNNIEVASEVVCNRLYKDHHETWDKLSEIEKDVCELTCDKYSKEIVMMWDSGLKEHFSDEENNLFPSIKNDDNAKVIDELISEHKEIISLIEEIKQSNDTLYILAFCELMKNHIKKEEVLMTEVAPDPYKEGGELRFYSNCVGYPVLSDLEAIIDNEKEIKYGTFIDNVNKEDRLALEKQLGYSKDFPITKDWHVRYFKSKDEDGNTVYFIRHSAIEYVFSKKGSGMECDYSPFKNGGGIEMEIVEVRDINGLTFDFDVNSDVTFDEVINLVVEKCKPQTYDYFIYKGQKHYSNKDIMESKKDNNLTSERIIELNKLANFQSQSGQNENAYFGIYDKENNLLGVARISLSGKELEEYIDSYHDLGFVLKKITKSEFESFDSDELTPDDLRSGDYEKLAEGGGVRSEKIVFRRNNIPKKEIYEYAKMVKEKYPKVWAKGGNIFGNKAFINLKRVIERGYWLPSEEWMQIKWQSYLKRHIHDYKINGVIAMLKWLGTVEKGWRYMKSVIEVEIEKQYPSSYEKFKNGGSVCGTGMRVQTLIFDKNEYTKSEAEKWAKKHDYITPYIDENEHSYRIRQENPKDFSLFRTKEFKKGLKAVVACPK